MLSTNFSSCLHSQYSSDCSFNSKLVVFVRNTKWTHLSDKSEQLSFLSFSHDSLAFFLYPSFILRLYHPQFIGFTLQHYVKKENNLVISSNPQVKKFLMQNFSSFIQTVLKLCTLIIAFTTPQPEHTDVLLLASIHITCECM